MPRRLKAKTQEMGDLELYLIYQEGEHWEKQWRPLQGEPITSLLMVVTKEDMDHLLYGWSKPFMQKIGIPPEGALRKLPSSLCYQRVPCPFHDRRYCTSKSKEIRICFEPDTIEDLEKRKLAADLVRLWKEGVYIVVVQE